ncbi:MAG: aminomethyl-transferring glycine dehydrogenase [Myxococcales bacterium]|nr:aminomethyl-transferring glycine dehydrogenase [Myxococcales bacterium]
MKDHPTLSSRLDASDTFVHRHIGPGEAELAEMLALVGAPSLDALANETVPEAIRLSRVLAITDAAGQSPRVPQGEHALLAALHAIASENRVYRSFIGLGYYDTIVPPVVQRNILENPGWYTQYTPYQAEIAQGRLEALLNFQTMVSELTGLPLAGASLLDEGTAAAEAMSMSVGIAGAGRHTFFVDHRCHPQTLAVVATRADSLGIKLVTVDAAALDFAAHPDAATLAGVLLQYPDTDGLVRDWRGVIAQIHSVGAQAVIATDLLALTLLTPPGELGADIVVGNSQRFGVPMGFGGPHAAFIATQSEHSRRMPGRIIGVSRDVHGAPALRMAIQTREQHIRREKATSNICTAQALLAIMAGMYAVWHGPEGLKQIAERVHAFTVLFAASLRAQGHRVLEGVFFDTVRVTPQGLDRATVLARCEAAQLNLRDFGDGSFGVSFDETSTRAALSAVTEVFAVGASSPLDADALLSQLGPAALAFEAPFARQSAYLTHPVFHQYRSEHLLLRYINKLRERDLSLTRSMIPLGSCTMKLNATSEMLPVTWREFGALHPFVPSAQSRGYQRVFADLERWLGNITGFAGVSLQPNAGSQGEYAGLLVIRAYHLSRGDGHRTVCLIPDSAHGTNPASAVIAGMRVVAVRCDEQGNIDLADLRAKAAAHAHELAAVMVTYPSTHGVFEESIKEVCEIVHAHGGQVYMDGANLNAQVGLCSPGDIGADVCHLNLHKTFCIPHGGGGPGMGPIGVAQHLVPFLPSHPVSAPAGASAQSIGPVSAAPYGSPSILTISWVYIALMGAEGLKRATQVAILNANYMVKRLEGHFPILYKGSKGRVAHEFILDIRPFDKSAGVKPDDVAKRLMDYGFHAPTMSWPVAGTLMFEPTESESKAELDRLCDAMISIRREIAEIESGAIDRSNNPLKNAPHTAHHLASEWHHPYTRAQAAYPAPWLKDWKFWPHVGRIDNPFGDRNLVCTCAPMSDYAV